MGRFRKMRRAMERECRAMDAEMANQLGVDLNVGGLVKAVVREYIGQVRDYQNRKYGCDELDQGWRFTFNHKAEKLNDEPICIYGIADPRDHIIRYVGWTKRPLQRRLAKHLSQPVGRYMAVWLKAMTDERVRPEIVPLEWCFNDKHEKKWIARLRAIGTLLNVTDGGDGKRHRCKGSRLRTVGGPVKIFTREEIDALYAPRGGV